MCKILICVIIFLYILSLASAQCPATNCPPISDLGIAEPAGVGFEAGQMCVETAMANGNWTTKVTCYGYDPNGIIQIFVRRLEGDVTPVYFGTIFGDGPISATFSCGTDGNWYLLDPPPDPPGTPPGTIYQQDVYCSVYCNEGVTCSSPTRPSDCPTSGGAAPACEPSTTTTTVAPAPTPPTCKCYVGGTWSAWSAATACNDTCGACGVTTRTRTCLSAASGCPCSGASSRQAPCNTNPCNYPRPSCCSPYTQITVETGFACGPIPSPPSDVPSTTCADGAAPGDAPAPPGGVPISGPQPPSCPAGGTWSEWSMGSCSDTCGMCGTQSKTRTCLSASSGCPCSGSSTDASMVCPSPICYFPRPTCCTGYSKVSNGSGWICV